MGDNLPVYEREVAFAQDDSHTGTPCHIVGPSVPLMSREVPRSLSLP